ncbi:MAG: metalloregulator ArsR/SmtB family transcription factor [Dethiosulfatibacter sp.]|nr:metalloregulator ArsR/SmtB family transcription factor [Dethiosulfatibacter sp.]
MDKDLQRCDAYCIHEDIVSTARDNMLHEDMVMELSELFKVLGDGTRINILRALAINEMCVCDIAALLCMSQSAISHQLRTLKNARLVKFRRDGKNIYYSLDDEHVEHMFNQGIEHIKHR